MLEIKENEYLKLTEFIKVNYGINLGKEKKALLVARLQKVLEKDNIKSFTEYYNNIVSDTSGDAVSTLADNISTNHTYFMREAGHFRFFKETVLPDLVNNTPSKDLSIWSAGCSSGEEPYTLAMLIDEFLGVQKAFWDAKILATDISLKVLDKARKGIYLDDHISVLPETWKRTYFKKFNNESKVLVDKIRNQIIFRRFNLIDSVFPFKKKFQIIFCRNVMIYFDAKTKIELVNKFYNITEPGGYLFIGHTENINRDESKYKYIAPAIYRK